LYAQTTCIRLVTTELYKGMLSLHTAMFWDSNYILEQQNKSTRLPQARVVQATCDDYLGHLLEIHLVHHCHQTIRKNYTPIMSTFQKVRIFHISTHIMVLKVMTQRGLEVTCIWESTRSPYLTWLSPLAQSGRWSSFGKWAWVTESHSVSYFFLLVVLFTQFILGIK